MTLPTLAPKITKMTRCMGCGAGGAMGLSFATAPDDKGLVFEMSLCLHCLRELDQTAWDARHTLDDFGTCPPCSERYGQPSACGFRRIVCRYCRRDDIAHVGRSQSLELPRGFRVVVKDDIRPNTFVCGDCFEVLEPG